MAEEIIIVQGTGVLTGEVPVSGAKNSALKLMAAALLGGGTTAIHNVPLISDIAIMSEVLRCLNARVEREGHTLVVDTGPVDKWETPYELVSKMRASIAVLGPLIGRFGQARVAMPGGCQIGARKIDMHLVGLEALGVEFVVDHGFLEATTPHGLTGAHVVLDFPSVGATENLLMAAVAAEGTTTVENAAREPEIVDLANMLNAMGARVSGGGSSLIEVEGVPVESLHPCEHTTVGDRIEAGTFLTGGALMGGPVTVRGIDPSYLRMALMKLEAMGCDVQAGADWITVRREGPLAPIDLQTLPHPASRPTCRRSSCCWRPAPRGRPSSRRTCSRTASCSPASSCAWAPTSSSRTIMPSCAAWMGCRVPTCPPPTCVPARRSCWRASRPRGRRACTTSAISTAATRTTWASWTCSAPT